MTKYSQEDLNDLTEEERAALTEDDGDGAGEETPAGNLEPDSQTDTVLEGEILDGSTEGSEDGADESDGFVVANEDDEIDPALLEEDGTGEEAGDDGVETGAPEPITETGAVAGDTLPTWVVPDTLNQNIEQIDAQRKALAEKFDDCELTATEFHEQMKSLEDQREKYLEEKRFADFEYRRELNHYSRKTVPEFIEANPVYQNPLFQDMLDQEVRKLQMQSKNPFNPNILQAAHQRISKAISDGYGIQPVAQRPVGQKATQPAPVPRRPPVAMPTLQNVPAAAGGVNDGQFAHLNRLADTDPIAFEDALERLPDAVREQYLNMA